MASEPQAPTRLKNAEWLAWPETRAVFAALTADGHRTRAVGGAVRNTLLGRGVGEVDMATDASPETVMELAGKAGLKAIATGLDHGTVTVVAEHRAFEVTTLRADVETFGRRAKVEFTDDWEGDARRRDFTINALYAEADGTLFDPLGGLADITAHRVRFIGDPGERIREDYLRILRFFRFLSELETPQIDPESLAACVRERAGLRQLAPERIHKELNRLLRGAGAPDALAAMYDNGLLIDLLGAVAHLPRLERMIALEEALGRQPDAALRLAALAVMTPEDAERLGDRFRLSNAERSRLAAAARYREVDAGMSAKAARRALYRRGAAAFHDCVVMAWAAQGAPPDDKDWRKLYDLPGRWQVPEFPLKGADIARLGVPEGPEIGVVLKAVERQWIAGNFSAGRDELLKVARRQAEDAGDGGGEGEKQ